MELREASIDGVKVWSASGRIDSTTAAAFGQRMEGALDAPSARLVLDLGGVEYVSSAGFRALLIAAQRCEAVGCRLALCGLSAKLEELFELGGFLELFGITSTRDEAVAMLQQ